MFCRLALWLMIVALPLQSFAAAGSSHCATEPVAALSAAVEHHNHAALQMHVDHAHRHHAPGHDSNHSASHCSPCCMGAMAAATPAPLTLPEGIAVFVPSPVRTLTSVALDSPQRPPNPSFA